MLLCPPNVCGPSIIKYNPNVNSGMEPFNRCQFTFSLGSKVSFGLDIYRRAFSTDEREVWDVVARNDPANAISLILELYFLSLQETVYVRLELVARYALFLRLQCISSIQVVCSSRPY